MERQVKWQKAICQMAKRQKSACLSVLSILMVAGSGQNLPAQTVQDTLAPQQLREITVQDKANNFTNTNLRGVENFGIYSGKKTEVVSLANLTANVSTNNPRQIYGRVTGLNIW